MPKLKTHKGTSKRFRLTGTKKLIRRQAGQDHFNTRESGKVTRRKRGDKLVPKTQERTTKTLLPYHN